jgi:hypothetical protein
MSVAVAVLLCLAAGYRLFVLRRHRNFLNAMYALTFVLAAAAFSAKVLERPIDDGLGPHTGDLIKHLLVVAMGAALGLYILAVNVGRPTRRSVLIRIGVAVVIALAMIVAFTAAPIHAAETQLDDEAGVWQMQVYLLLFNGYLTNVLVENIRLYRRFAAAPGDQGRSMNLRLVGWGSAIGLVYTASRLLSVFSIAVLGQPLPALEKIGSVAALIGAACVGFAVFFPPLVSWFQERRTAQQGIQRLGPLWTDLTATYPAVVLDTSSAVSRRSPEFIFDRRLVETSECLRLVRLPEPVRDQVLGATHPTLALATQLRRERSGWSTANGPTPAELLPPPAGRAEETAVLLELADHYAAAVPAVPAAQR